MKGVRAAVVGAGGFIGTNLCDYLLGRGVAVRALSRGWIRPPPAGADTVLTADANDREAIEEVIADSSCVVVLSHGLLPGSELEKAGRDMLDSLSISFHLIEQCARRRIRLIYLSSGGTVYGPDVPVPTREDAPCNPINMYGVSKLATENVLRVYGRQCGLDYRVLRVSNPYGPWQLGRNGQGVIGAWLRQALSGREIEVWGDGSVVRDYIYVDDLLRAILAAIEYEGSDRIFNIGSGRGESLRNVLDVIQQLCDVRVRFGESRPVDVPMSVLDISRASAELKWAPVVQLQRGIDETLRWMSEWTATREMV